MSCRKFDTAFREAEQQISDDLVEKKFRLGQNAYWGRVRDNGMFPTRAGTRIKKVRLSRIGFGQMDVGWTAVEDNGCFTNLCEEPPAEVISHGSEDSYYGLEKFKIATDEICLSMLPFREMPEKELAHFENHLKMAGQYFWNEWLRSRYINIVEKKFVAMVSDNALTSGDICDTLESACAPYIDHTNGFIMWNRGADGLPVLDQAYPVDERYVSVNVPLAKVPNISELSGDLIEQAAADLELDDDNMPLLDEGIDLLDVIVPDLKMLRRLVQLERMQEAQCLPSVLYDGKDLSRRLGIKRIIRDQFGIRRDLHGMKFYPDNLYNSTLGAYSKNDPTTWPRFKRVFAYTPQANANGSVNYVPNRFFSAAPFGISVIFTPTVMGMLHHPEAEGFGTARPGENTIDYAGQATWVNEYDKKCNPKRDRGHWELHFGAGIEPDRPENGSAFFHRIDHRLSLSGVACPIPLVGCLDSYVSPYCYESVQAGEAALGVTIGGRGANIADNLNGVKYFI